MQTFDVSIPDEVTKEIIHYVNVIAEDSLVSASKWLADIEAKIFSLRISPKRCPVAFEDRFHEYEIRNLIIGNYRIIFRIQDKTVQILHLKHRKMERKPFLIDDAA